VGSLMAMGLAFRKLNKQITLYNESVIPAVYRFLPAVSLITRQLNPEKTYDTAVILDCGSMDRIGRVAAEVEKTPVVINLDHHITNTGFGDHRLVDPAASSTAEIVFRVIEGLGVSMDEAIAVAIYTGILTDTGSFRFANTTKEAFAICDKMVSAGVKPYAVAQKVYGTYSLGRLKLLNFALDSIEISNNGKLSIMTLSQRMLDETGTQSEDIDGLIHYARRIEDVKVAALIQELAKNGTKTGDFSGFHVSLRSDGDVNVAEIASAFGGGGHTNAAGFSVNTTLSEIKSQMIGLAEEM